jgi:hypothetical protein
MEAKNDSGDFDLLGQFFNEDFEILSIVKHWKENKTIIYLTDNYINK